MGKGKIRLGVRALLVFADLHQQFHLRVFCQNLAQGLRRLLVLLVHNGVHHAADAGLHVNGRIMVGGGQLA